MSKEIRETGDGVELFERLPDLSKYGTRSRAGFSSPEAFAAWLESPEGVREKWSTSGRDNGDMGGDFYGFTTFRDALDMALTGWKEGAERVERLRDKINVANPKGPRLVSWGVAGAYPSVARALAGNPLNMRKLDLARAKRKPVMTIVSHYGATADVDAQSMERRAACAAALVDEVETAGFSVELIAYTASSASNVVAETAFVLKEAGAALDVARVAFGLGHPAMLRRLTFAIRSSRREAKPLGAGMGSTIYDGLKLPPGCYMLPAIQYLGAGKFRSDELTVKDGLPAMIAALRAQDCPAFPKDERAAA